MTEWAPNGSAEVVKVAWPVEAFNGTEPTSELSTTKSTTPVGWPTPRLAGCTVAVKVIGWPTGENCCDVERVVVVAEEVTTLSVPGA